MKDVKEFIEVITLSYTQGISGALPAIVNITKGWLDPTIISGITSGTDVFSVFVVRVDNELLCPTWLYSGAVVRGEKFTALRTPDGIVLVLGQPEELFEKVSDKLKELKQNPE